MTELIKKRQNLFSNTLHLDILRMKKYSGFGQFFACFTSPEFFDDAKKRALFAFHNFINEIEKNSKYIMLVKNFNEFTQAIEQNKIAAFFSLEGGEPIEEIFDVELFYNMGVRMIALTWNYDNKLASGVLGNDDRGLTEFGKKVVLKMNELGIVADVSHLNEKSFWEVSEISKYPLTASHSNSYYVCKNKRNLTDCQFKRILDTGGYVGINLYPPFLTDLKHAKVSDILLHIEHFLALGGEDIIGFGCDFDGVDKLPIAINGIENIYCIINEMQKIGYSEDLIEKITHKNCEKIIKLF